MGDFDCGASDARLSLEMNNRVIQKLGIESLLEDNFEEAVVMIYRPLFFFFKTRVSKPLLLLISKQSALDNLAVNSPAHRRRFP